MSTPTVWSLLNKEAELWDVATYENAKYLVCAMRSAGVSEHDADFIRCIQKIRQYRQTQLEADICAFDICEFPN